MASPLANNDVSPLAAHDESRISHAKSDGTERAGDGDRDEPAVPSGYVRLVSGDGFSFTVDMEYACVSPVIKTMLNSTFKESHTRIIHLPHVSGRVLETVCQYFYYVQRFRARRSLPSHGSTGQTPASSPLHPFEPSVETFPIPPDISVDVFLCAKYLDL